jgi:hypothetical protein
MLVTYSTRYLPELHDCQTLESLALRQLAAATEQEVTTRSIRSHVWNRLNRKVSLLELENGTPSNAAFISTPY